MLFSVPATDKVDAFDGRSVDAWLAAESADDLQGDGVDVVLQGHVPGNPVYAVEVTSHLLDPAPVRDQVLGDLVVGVGIHQGRGPAAPFRRHRGCTLHRARLRVRNPR